MSDNIPECELNDRLRHLWHPCAQMKDYETFPPLEVVGAEGCYLHLSDGRTILDAIASWWCKSLGHRHPRLVAAVQRQMAQFEHVILANTSNQLIRDLSARLAAMCQLDRVFFAGDGSMAVEIAAKMSVQAHQLRGHGERRQFAALKDGYHGETALTLGLSDIGLFGAPYTDLAIGATCVEGVPFVHSTDDPLWDDCSAVWPDIEAQLAPHVSTLAAMVVEPVVQGAAGMKIYSADFLRRLRRWTTDNDVYLIADEIMTGFGRTGRALACDHAGIRPDFVCLSKGLTAGWMAFSATVTSDAIYRLFYDDYESGKGFMHSNTYCGNALGAAVALEALNVYAEEQVFERAAAMQAELRAAFQSVADETGAVTNIRGIGAIVAGDLVLPPERKADRIGYAVYQEAVARGALLRPIGNTMYWLPPLTISRHEIAQLRDITTDAVQAVFARL